DAQGPRNKGLSFKHELLRHYTGLKRNGIDVQMICEDSDISGYKLIVAPMLYMLREDFAQKLREFVKNGGTLVVTYWSGVVNETDLCYLGDAPHGLVDVLGVRRMEIDAMYDGETRRCVSECDALPETASGSILCEVAALEGATPLMVYDEDYFAGAPAVTVNDFGEGKAYYVATRFEEEFYQPLYKMICEGVVESCWPGHLPEGVLACSRGEYVFLLNTKDAVIWFENAELAPYGVAVYKKNGDALDLIYNQMAFNWSPVK
ncbi:MAG: beta-galactosidase trimerization domain-containing protein, partial [Clostridia bacterium]|nr:beta-galactosidase trimerization domain-containing protein [Clostridia bacterium]